MSKKAGQNNFGCESTLFKAWVNRKEFYLLLYLIVLKGVLLSSLLDHVVLRLVCGGQCFYQYVYIGSYHLFEFVWHMFMALCTQICKTGGLELQEEVYLHLTTQIENKQHIRFHRILVWLLSFYFFGDFVCISAILYKKRIV